MIYNPDDYTTDTIDYLADEQGYLEEELAYIHLEEEREEQALMYGVPVSMIKPIDAIYQIVQWIIKYGTIKKTSTIAGGRMTTKQEIVDCGGYGKYYLKTGWYTKNGVSAHTLTPDEFLLELVTGEVQDGKVI